jgi:Family of unknown function (DUF5372)
MIRSPRCPVSSTTPDPDGERRSVRVTHPFHPWRGREFVLLSVRQTWSEDRVFFLDVDSRRRYPDPHAAGPRAASSPS